VSFEVLDTRKLCTYATKAPNIKEISRTA